MAFAQSSRFSQLYSQTKEEKQYEALILFVVPILSCILLLILCYLFYLEMMRDYNFSHPPPLPSTPPSLPPTFVESFSFNISVREAVSKEDLIGKLPTIVFDEELKARDLLCCVCLGEFKLKEELIQMPSCKHIFHSDCIGNWLSSNATCPLCRCSVVVVDDTKLVLPPPQRSPVVRLLQSDLQQANIAD